MGVFEAGFVFFVVFVAGTTGDAGPGGSEIGGTSAGTGVLAAKGAGRPSIAEKAGLFATEVKYGGFGEIPMT